MNFDSIAYNIHRTIFKWITILNIKGKIKLLEENIKKLYELEVAKNFLHMTYTYPP